MNQPINDGGQAFPRAVQFDDAFINGHGMTLRDYFAAAALQGFCGNQNCNPTTSTHFANLADDSYQAADAMLKARGAKL